MALTDCLVVQGATALEEGLHERSSTGATTGQNSGGKSLEKRRIRFSVATGPTTAIIRKKWLALGRGQGMEDKCVTFTPLEFCLELRDR